MRVMLDNELPQVVSEPKSKVWMLPLILLFLIGLGAAFILGMEYMNLKHESQEQLATKDIEIASLSRVMQSMQYQLDDLRSANDRLEESSLVHAAKSHTSSSEGPQNAFSGTYALSADLLGLVSNDIVIGELPDLDVRGMMAQASQQTSPATRVNMSAMPVDQAAPLLAFSDQQTIDEMLFTKLPKPQKKNGKKLFSSWSPVAFFEAGATMTIDDDLNRGVEAALGLEMFPHNRWGLAVSTGVTNQRTSIINQSAAAQAGFNQGLAPITLEQRVQEVESKSIENYSFFNLQLGTSYKFSPRFKLRSDIKASYIMDRNDFAETSIEREDGSFLSVRESLSALVDNNQVYRWGFSGVVGADYTISDRLDLQLRYNKYITPLVTQVTPGAADQKLSDFTKLGLRYNF